MPFIIIMVLIFSLPVVLIIKSIITFLNDEYFRISALKAEGKYHIKELRYPRITKAKKWFKQLCVFLKSKLAIFTMIFGGIASVVATLLLFIVGWEYYFPIIGACAVYHALVGLLIAIFGKLIFGKAYTKVFICTSTPVLYGAVACVAIFKLINLDVFSIFVNVYFPISVIISILIIEYHIFDFIPQKNTYSRK